MRSYAWLGCILSVVLACAHENLQANDLARDQRQLVVEEESNAKAEIGLPEQQVIYSDMIAAYQQGRLSEARNLARAYLQHFSTEMNTAGNDRNREAAVHATLDVIYWMLEGENKLLPGTRLGGDVDLLLYTESELLQARDVFNRLHQPLDRGKEFIQRKIGKDSEFWIRAGRALVSRGRLETHRQKFKSELEALGHASVDDVLSAVKPLAPPVQKTQTVSDADRSNIFKLIENYYLGFSSGNTKLIAAATGLGSPETVALLMDTYNKELKQDGVDRILKVTLPAMSAESYDIRQSSGKPDIYSVAVKGIQMRVIQAGGAQSTRSIDKLLQLRREKTGNWTVVTSE